MKDELQDTNQTKYQYRVEFCLIFFCKKFQKLPKKAINVINYYKCLMALEITKYLSASY